MSRTVRSTRGALTIVATLLIGSLPLHAQGTQQSAIRTPAQIAAAARAATVQVRALDADGSALGSGTGFFVNAEGVLVTNLHVIADAHALQVRTLDGEIYDLVYYLTADPRRDIAVLRVPVESRSHLALARDTLAVGDRIFVMGNPLGQTGTFSDGLVSASRMIEGVGMLQITAPISPGSSGGPVMNERGAVVGVATLMLRGGQNLNYAVPARYVRPLLAIGERPRRFDPSLLPRDRVGLAAVAEPRGSTPSPGRSGPTSSDPAPAESELSAAQRSIVTQVVSLDSTMRESQLAPSGVALTGMLQHDRSDWHNVSLARGVDYLIVGVCDVDCTDLDLSVYDSRGRLLESDMTVGDVPRVIVRPTVSGVYRVRATMAACSVDPCYYAVRVYR